MYRALPNRQARGGTGECLGRPRRRARGDHAVPGGADRPGRRLHDGRQAGRGWRQSRRRPERKVASGPGRSKGGTMIAILRRELVTLLRTRRAVAVQVGLALVFALLIGLRWPTEAHVGLSGAESRQVLDIFGYGLLTCILVLVPAFPATSLVR